MAKFSLTQAAKQVGKSKPTISKAIKTGRLSAEKVGNGYEIDAAELFRVYPKIPATFDAEATADATRVALLELEAKMLRQQLEREQETVADLRARLDKAGALITDTRPRKWFWQRWRL
jgi:excisionase family DNA binding protein